ncbi:hypothetical protein AVEN_249899-1 [Araneus ventricosus]|uniref:Uncharacterized protein n=1 Tax=Araneus ventricosus TaxID=182803 RepID=A0A4Y2J3J9_ARAVE|nr:hypothetical protein AVEN_249899-1 [Araneus ventricosus]
MSHVRPTGTIAAMASGTEAWGGFLSLYLCVCECDNLKRNNLGTVDSRLTGIGLPGSRIIRDDPPKKEARWGRWNVREDRILLNPSYCIRLVQPTLSPDRLQLDCSENVDDEAVEQWINEDSTLECCDVLSDDDIRLFWKCG